MVKYIMVSWPEIQDFMNDKRWEDCVFCQSVKGHQVPDSTWMIPEDFYNDIKNQFPREFQTNIGTIVCYEDKAFVNSEEFIYDRKIKKGDKVLVYIPNENSWQIAYCKITEHESFPLVLDDSSLLTGINCEIIGSNGKV